MKPDSGFVLVNSIRLHYLRWGSAGPTVVFLHGNSHCGGVWAPLAEQLASDFSVVAVDLRGHGLSDKPDSGYDWATLRTDIAGLIETLNPERLLLVGHSRGGGVALLAGAAMPERVKGVLVFEPTFPSRTAIAASPAATPDDSRRAAMVQRALRRRTSFGSRQELFDQYRERDAFRGWRDDYLWAYIEHGSVVQADGSIELACPPWVEAKLYEAISIMDAWDELRCPDLPVLAIYGERSSRLSGGRGPIVELETMFSRCQATIMPEATHFGPMERPELFERQVRQFALSIGFGTAQI